MAATTPHILLLGGHGRISLLLTRKIIAKSWNLTSVIRNPDQKSAILKVAGTGEDGVGKNGGKVDVLVESLDEVKSLGDAERILERVKPDWVVWSAGAGGKGGVSRTYAIDRDACKYFIQASTTSPNIKKFLLVSAIASRSSPAPWWTSSDISAYKNGVEKGLPDYYKAKIAADETLAVLGEERIARDWENALVGFGWISLRPGLLDGEEETGRVKMGRIGVQGKVSRGDVAEVALKLLEKEGVKGWFDLLGAEESEGGEVKEELERVLSEGIDAFEGEKIEELRKRVKV